MSLPIVIVHVNDSIYLLHCLMQAMISNPDSKIYLISNDQTKHYQFVEHHNISDYLSGAEEFASVYKHLHTNEISGNLFTFQRWFILRDFMKKNGLSECIHIDSDIMLYCDINEEQERFSQYDLTLSNSKKAYKAYSAHCTFINSFEVLDDLCNFLKNLYVDSELFKLLESRAAEGRGGVSEMTGLYYYTKFTDYSIGFTSDIIDGSVYDHSIQSADDFGMQDDYKNILWRDGNPYCRHLPTGKEVRLKTIHCQGKAKTLMQSMVSHSDIRLKYSRLDRAVNYIKLGVSKKLSGTWIKI